MSAIERLQEILLGDTRAIHRILQQDQFAFDA